MTQLNNIKALIFDCDGVLVDTEKDGHRVAFNRAFKSMGLNITWSIEKYAELLQVAGGKERMRYFFNSTEWPLKCSPESDSYIKDLHKLKTTKFLEIIESGELKLRPGVARIVDEAIQAKLKLAVCSTSALKSVQHCLNLLGEKRVKHFEFVLAGDVVSNKKPHPEIYMLAHQKLGIKANQCMVIEDSRVGMLAAVRAGMNCIVSKSAYTANENFSEANLVVPELGDSPANVSVTDFDVLAS